MPEQTQEQSTYQVHVKDVFDGPLDLLVYLVKKNEVDIYDIPIALITEQYLDYLNLMRALNIDVAGEFLVMAATLAHIKSRMLLPVDPDEEEEAEDPRMEIVRPLAEYLQFKQVADNLQRYELLDRDVFVPIGFWDSKMSEGEPRDLVRVGLVALIEAFQVIVKRVSSDDVFNITPDAISVKSRIGHIVDLLEQRDSVTFEELFENDVTRGEIIVTFLAILEMAKSQVIRIMQHISSGVIRIFYE